MSTVHHTHEELVATLNDHEALRQYKESGDNFQPHWLPKTFGWLLVTCGNIVFGEKPSYGKFKAVEVIARIPYQSWELVSYMLLTFFYADEERAIRLTKTSRFGRAAQDNETMHVVVISKLARKHGEGNFLIHTLIPLTFSFFYFSISFLLYLLNPKFSFQLNYMFEDHAFSQYARFIRENEEHLKSQPMLSDFLELYGRHSKSEYEFFLSVRNDELIHRNASLHEMETYS